jgi:glycosyltransferase involved in cell wall biosynthesis
MRIIVPATANSASPAGPDVPTRTVLMVLYFFPPVGGISTSRNIRNVEYLPRYGWSPVVVTPAEAGYPVKDPSLLDLVAPTVEVIRTGSLEAGHVRAWVSWIGRFLRMPRPGRGRAARSEPIRDGNGAADSTSSAREPDGLLFRIRRFVFFPDDQIGWLPFALRAALRRHRVAPVDVVYSTASPITSHLVAGLFKRRTGVPWVAEFRDPWLGTALAKPIPWLHRRIKAKLERWIIQTADQVVFLAPSTARMYQERYPFATNFVVIPNGYDRSETTVSSRPAEAGRRFRIVYTGLLFRPIELAVFFDGLDRLAARRPKLIEQLEVLFYGAVDPACQEVADRALANERLSRVVDFRGYVPRREALQAVADADAALVLLGAGPGMGVYIPGKLFDYLGQSRQILAMLPKGDAWDVLDELDWGVAAEPDAIDVERAIERVMTLPPPTGPVDPDGRYDRVGLAGRLAETLTEAAEPRSPDHRVESPGTGPRPAGGARVARQRATVAKRHDRTGGGANDPWTTAAAEPRHGGDVDARVRPDADGRSGTP